MQTERFIGVMMAVAAGLALGHSHWLLALTMVGVALVLVSEREDDRHERA